MSATIDIWWAYNRGFERAATLLGRFQNDGISEAMDRSHWSRGNLADICDIRIGLGIEAPTEIFGVCDVVEDAGATQMDKMTARRTAQQTSDDCIEVSLVVCISTV
jgi:hypothetical protein